MTADMPHNLGYMSLPADVQAEAEQAAANPMPDPFTGFVPTGVSQRQLDAAADHKPDPLEEFFASGFSQQQLDALAEHAGSYLRHGPVPGLQVVADAIDRARDLAWREARR